MEIRSLEYFLAVAREQNITKAAESLHLTQPTLSRQLMELENELGKKLFIRGKRRMTLTEDGLFFRKRAEEIITLIERTTSELSSNRESISGDVYIGTGESAAIRHIMELVHGLQEEHPGVHFHFTSGDREDLVDRLDSGLFDFSILYGEIDQAKYEYLTLPFVEKWGVLCRRDTALAKKSAVEPRDLWDQRLVLSRQMQSSSGFLKWFQCKPGELRVTNTYNLVYNGSLLAELGCGVVLTLENLVNTEGTSLCFRPLSPVLTLNISIVWKKYKSFSKAAELFLERLESAYGNNE